MALIACKRSLGLRGAALCHPYRLHGRPLCQASVARAQPLDNGRVYLYFDTLYVDQLWGSFQAHIFANIAAARGWPCRLPPVNALFRTSRCAAHNSGPGWIAAPFLLETFTLCSLPISAH